ncbi:unnamed protein product [Ilex paraguariensis]|uniref:Protein SAR DEFICIENT 1 n=1 Tax=Ilex paraguariensis TaxID=185542 RepID=A0ABC8RP75_9AQUA
MAAERFSDESGPDPDQPNQKRTGTKPCFASVIREVVKVNLVEKLCSTLEPMVRRVVNEEAERVIRLRTRSLTRSPSLRIRALEPSTLQLVFSGKLSPPIFSRTKILDTENNPLKILLADTRGDQMLPTTLSFPIKVEVVVLDGDFPPADHQTWTRDEFDRNIVKERAGKPPLLTGDLNVSLRDGFALVGDIEFTDNSSWIRSRRFRLGARVVQGTSHGVIVREAMTESFIVKDHRGEYYIHSASTLFTNAVYKKHHPPMLEDDVWRLEKIGKDGRFHKKLASEGIDTVQDFLKLSVVDPSKLRRILGRGMSEKMWEVTLKHARTCVLGSKRHRSRGPNYTVVLNPICQVVTAMIEGQIFSNDCDLTSMHKAYIESLVRDAYANWNSLEEVDGLLNETTLLTQGDLVDQYPNQAQSTVARLYQQHAFLTDGSIEGASVQDNGQGECSDQWVINCANLFTPFENGVCNNISESSSDGEVQRRRRFIHEN